MEKSSKFNFDKFVSDLSKREAEGRDRIKKFQEEKEELPQRKYNKLYREDWRNRVTFRRKK